MKSALNEPLSKKQKKQAAGMKKGPGAEDSKIDNSYCLLGVHVGLYL